MLRRANQIDDYFKVKIESASPMGLVYMVYERAIQSLEEAERGFKLNKRDHFSHHLIHTQDCIRELKSSLNLKIGGEIAASLHNLYEFMINELIDAHIDRSEPMVKVKRVKKMVSELLQTWKQAEKKLNNEKLEKQSASSYESLCISG